MKLKITIWVEDTETNKDVLDDRDKSLLKSFIKTDLEKDSDLRVRQIEIEESDFED